MHRVENDLIFEELKFPDKVNNAAAIVLEKDCKFNNSINLLKFSFVAYYWFYHRNVVDDYEEERM
jgi:hypothetical protein